jgi:hypothetical protein
VLRVSQYVDEKGEYNSRNRTENSVMNGTVRNRNFLENIKSGILDAIIICFCCGECKDSSIHVEKKINVILFL